MSYDLGRVDINALILPVCQAGDAIARLDECIARSPIKVGFMERQDFADAVASMWSDGELVHVEDLVLHDVKRDARAPTHELTIAHSVLRSRRQIFEHPSDWALSAAGMTRLRGKPGEELMPEIAPPPLPFADMDDGGSDEDEEDAAFAEIDAILARTNTLIDTVLDRKTPLSSAPDRDTLVYDADWDEDQRLEEWHRVFGATDGLPPVLRAALLLDSWNQLQVLQHRPELGRQLVASFLRREGVARAHLPAINTGWKAIRIEKRRSKSKLTRLLAILEAFELASQLGLKEHDRLLAAKSQLDRKTINRRGNSRLPQLIDLVISRPVVSASLISAMLDVTPQGALVLTKELGLREMTGRGRYRAWGVL